MIPLLLLFFFGTSSPTPPSANDLFSWEKANSILVSNPSNAVEAVRIYRELNRPGTPVHSNLILAHYLSGDLPEAQRQLRALETLAGESPELLQTKRALDSQLSTVSSSYLPHRLQALPLSNRLELLAGIWCALWLLLIFRKSRLRPLMITLMTLASATFLTVLLSVIQGLRTLLGVVGILLLLTSVCLATDVTLSTPSPRPIVGYPCEVHLRISLPKRYELYGEGGCNLLDGAVPTNLRYEQLPTTTVDGSNIYHFVALYTPTNTQPITCRAPLQLRIARPTRSAGFYRATITTERHNPAPLLLTPQPSPLPTNVPPLLAPAELKATVENPEILPGAVLTLNLSIQSEYPLPNNLDALTLNLPTNLFRPYPPQVQRRQDNRIDLSYPIVVLQPTNTLPAQQILAFSPGKQTFQTLTTDPITLTPTNLPPQPKLPQPITLRLLPSDTAVPILTLPPNTPLPPAQQTFGSWQRVSISGYTGWLQRQ